LYFTVLLFFSVALNQYYGYLGINPIDSFISFNSGFDILNGYFPFKDYWTITGPFIDFIQAIFFKIFGISWFSYILHASIFNFIFAISVFYTLHKFELNVHYCFIYAFLVSVLAYPSAGTPYVDHHSSFLSIISIFCFILALKTSSKKYWFSLPILLGIAFLSKQTPAAYIVLLIVFLSIIYFIFNFSLKKITYGVLGSFFFIFTFVIIFLIAKISLLSFFQQYVLFPISLGESRLNFLFPLEFNRIILRFKLLHLSSLLLIIVSIKKIIQDYKYLKTDEFLITVSLIGSSYALIIHQLMTVNGMFIFFIIPILAGFSHIYYLKYFKDKKYILYLLIFLSCASTVHYGIKYINSRDFMDLRKVNLKKSIDAKILSNKLNGLNWITVLYPDNPKEEISRLLEVIKIIKNDTRKKTIVTDYQFISVILSTYDYSPNKYWYSFHAHPKKGTKYYETYKDFFINKLKDNEIEIAYTVKPLWGGDEVFEFDIDEKCFSKNEVTPILVTYLLKDCEELRK